MKRYQLENRNCDRVAINGKWKDFGDVESEETPRLLTWGMECEEDADNKAVSGRGERLLRAGRKAVSGRAKGCFGRGERMLREGRKDA